MCERSSALRVPSCSRSGLFVESRGQPESDWPGECARRRSLHSESLNHRAPRKATDPATSVAFRGTPWLMAPRWSDRRPANHTDPDEPRLECERLTSVTGGSLFHQLPLFLKLPLQFFMSFRSSCSSFPAVAVPYAGQRSGCAGAVSIRCRCSSPYLLHRPGFHVRGSPCDRPPTPAPTHETPALTPTPRPPDSVANVTDECAIHVRQRTESVYGTAHNSI